MPEIGLFNWMKDSELTVFGEVLRTVDEINAEGGTDTLEDLEIIAKSVGADEVVVIEPDDEMRAIEEEVEAYRLAVDGLSVFQGMRRSGRIIHECCRPPLNVFQRTPSPC